MRSKLPSPDNESPFRHALTIAVLYCVIGGLWIQFSDSFLETVFHDPHLLTLAQTAKGWGFVLVTAILVLLLTFGLLRRSQSLREETGRARRVLERIGEQMREADPERLRSLVEDMRTDGDGGSEEVPENVRRDLDQISEEVARLSRVVQRQRALLWGEAPLDREQSGADGETRSAKVERR